MVRPRLLIEPPLLWVSGHHVQWGDDPVRVPVTAALIRWVRDLDGTRTLTTALEHAPDSRASAELLVSAGYRCGHIADAATAPVRWFWGDDHDRSTSLALTRLLLAESAGFLGTADVNRILDERGRVHVTADDPHGHLTGLDPALEAAGLRTRTVTTGEESLRILVSCGHTDVVHDARGHLDSETGMPHLHVGLTAEAVVVGPLVVPGETSCLRCVHLHRRDRDPHWPLRAVQWAHRHEGRCTVPPTSLTTWAIYAAVTLVSVWCDARLGHRSDDLWRNTAFRLPAHSLVPEREGRPEHPLCGCTWPDPG